MSHLCEGDRAEGNSQEIEPIDVNLIPTPFYCEENVYRHLQRFVAASVKGEIDGEHAFAIIISNHQKTVMLHNQISEEGTGPVVWDYHVVACCFMEFSVGEGTKEWMIVDFNSSLGVCTRLPVYMKATFPTKNSNEPIAPIPYQSRFRIIRASDYLTDFASDRSHMLDEGDYLAPVPPHPCIQGSRAKVRNETHNLFTHFVNFSSERDGIIVDNVEGVIKYFASLKVVK